MELAVAAEISRFEGVALALPSTALSKGNIADTALTRSVLSNYNPNRSGDIYLVFEPNRFISDFGGLVVAAAHGSPWRYDTYVPIIFAGMDIPAQKVHRRVYTTAIAPTLSLYIGAKPPTGSMDEALTEVLNRN